MAVDYVNSRFPGAKATFNLRVGPPRAEAADLVMKGIEPTMLKVLDRYVDAFVELPDKNVLIEFKIEDEIGAVAQLLMYRQLLFQTPGYQAAAARPLDLLLVTARPSSQIRSFAESMGIKVDVFQPPYIVPLLIDRRLVTTNR